MFGNDTVFTVNVTGCDCYQSGGVVGQFGSIVARNKPPQAQSAASLQEVPIFILGVTSSASAAVSQSDFVHVAAAV